MSPYRYLSLLVMPAMVWIGYLAGGYWNFITPVVCFIVLPLIELSFPHRLQYYEQEAAPVKVSLLYRLIPILFVMLIVSTVSAATIIAGKGSLHTHEWIGLLLSVGILNGAIGFTLAHEFIHRFTPVERYAGYLLLCCNYYLHYSVEHVYGHHVYACTNLDPHTAGKGETFYRFLPRAIMGTWLNAWKIEGMRLRKRGHPFLSIYNKMLLFLLIEITIVLIIILNLGTGALLFYLAQGFIAIILLHQVNYLQHYGLIRKRLDNGKLEKMSAHHSWNTANPWSRFSLFQLENHADHHIHPTHTYEKLTVHSESPTHPANYVTMMLISLVPPVWFNIIHKRIPAHF